MPKRPAAAALALSLAACAGPAAIGRPLEAGDALTDRLADGARALEGRGHAPFRVGRETFAPDCSGFVEAVYEGAGVPLRRLMREAAPRARSGVVAAWRALERYGRTFGAGISPLPGDVVFWRFTYDRDRNGRLDDGITHMGVVVGVDGDTVTFLHRGGAGVERGVMTLDRRDARRDADGRELNSPLRVKRRAWAGAPDLAGELFAGYGRIDPSRLAASR